MLHKASISIDRGGTIVSISFCYVDDDLPIRRVSLHPSRGTSQPSLGTLTETRQVITVLAVVVLTERASVTAFSLI